MARAFWKQPGGGVGLLYNVLTHAKASSLLFRKSQEFSAKVRGELLRDIVILNCGGGGYYNPPPLLHPTHTYSVSFSCKRKDIEVDNNLFEQNYQIRKF